MGLYLPHASLGYLHGGAVELDRQLRDGDGVLWAGDPRLELTVGVLTARRNGPDRHTGKWQRKGDVVARRYEVWRHNEDGTDGLIGHWTLEEFDRILLDLAGMRMGAPGHVPTEDKIDQANAVKEAEATQQIHDSLGEAMEHGAKLWHDTHEPRNVFRGMPGRRDLPKDEPEGTGIHDQYGNPV